QPLQCLNEAPERKTCAQAHDDVEALRLGPVVPRVGVHEVQPMGDATRGGQSPRRVEEPSIAVDPGAMNIEAASPLPHQPGLAATEIEDAQAIAEIAVGIEKLELAVGDRVLD